MVSAVRSLLRLRSDELVAPEILKLLANPAGAALADCDRADHRGDPDRDSEHGQRGPQLVAAQRRNRHGKNRRKVHAARAAYSRVLRRPNGDRGSDTLTGGVRRQSHFAGVPDPTPEA